MIIPIATTTACSSAHHPHFHATVLQQKGKRSTLNGGRLLCWMQMLPLLVRGAAAVDERAGTTSIIPSPAAAAVPLRTPFPDAQWRAFVSINTSKCFVRHIHCRLLNAAGWLIQEPHFYPQYNVHPQCQEKLRPELNPTRVPFISRICNYVRRPRFTYLDPPTHVCFL